MLQRDLDFAVWWARRCLHLWNAPEEVREWLHDPKPKIAAVAEAARAALAAQIPMTN